VDEEAKARYGTVENTTKRVVTPNKQTNKQHIVVRMLEEKQI
jgi:hypothetical protein